MTKHSDFGPGEKLQHSIYEFEDVDVTATGRKRLKNLTPFALDRYWKRNQLAENGADNDKLFDAGNRYRDTFQDAGLQPDVISRYSEMVGKGSIQDFFAGNMDAREEWIKASKALGPQTWDIVTTCCCFGRPVGKLDMNVLRRGLWQLVRHYGY